MSEDKKATKEAARIIGREMRRLAFERELEGPYVAADYVIAWAKENDWSGPVHSRSTMADYFRGKVFPNRDFVNLFTEAMGLNANEQRQLSWTFTYPFPVAA